MSEYRKEKQISREREMDSMRGWGERKRDRKGKREGGGRVSTQGPRKNENKAEMGIWGK